MARLLFRFVKGCHKRCQGKLRRGGVGMVLLFLICYLLLSWRSEGRSRGYHGLARNVIDLQRKIWDCPGCKMLSSPLLFNKIEAEKKVEEDMRRRSALISDICNELPQKDVLKQTDHLMVSRRHKFLYCPVEKSASTFWRRFMYQLIRTEPMQSPFKVSVQTVYSGKFPASEVHIKEKKQDLEKLLNSSTRMIFLREPYSRLLSAYVDKLLAPNPVVWKMWGLPSIRLCRESFNREWCKKRNTTDINSSVLNNNNNNNNNNTNNNNNASRPERIRPRSRGSLISPRASPPDSCGHDVTFPEFIKLVTTRLAMINPHVMPISHLCSPCFVNYTVVGHMETFARDVRHLLPKINISETQVQLEKMDESVAYDAIEDSVHDSMSPGWLRASLRCISKMDVVNRIWRKLQIRGFVSWRIRPSDLNIDADVAESIEGPALIRALVEANRQSTDRNELKLQKKQALDEALSALQPKQFLELSQLFDLDFKLFGFTKLPKAFDAFREGTFVNTGALDLNKDWNLDKIL